MPQPRPISWKTEPRIATSHSSDKVIFNNFSTGPRENDLDVKNEDTLKYVTRSSSDTIFLNIFSSDVESLKKGIIKTSKNKAKMSYTILLVGETGVGKSSA